MAEPKFIHLYHRTTVQRAIQILREKRMQSLENDGSIYASTQLDGQAAGFGEAIVHLRVPAEIAEIDDAFPSGEEHYRVNKADLKPEHYQGGIGL